MSGAAKAVRFPAGYTGLHPCVRIIKRSDLALNKKAPVRELFYFGTLIGFPVNVLNAITAKRTGFFFVL